MCKHILQNTWSGNVSECSSAEKKKAGYTFEGCETDWKDIHQMLTMIVCEQLIGKFVFLFVSLKIFYKKQRIFKKLVYAPNLTLAIRTFSALENCSWHGLKFFLTSNISITKHFNFLTMERK